MFFFSRIKRFQVLHGDWLAAKGLGVVTFDFQVLIIHVSSSFFICFFTFTLSIADERISILGTGSSRFVTNYWNHHIIKEKSIGISILKRATLLFKLPC